LFQNKLVMEVEDFCCHVWHAYKRLHSSVYGETWSHYRVCQFTVYVL